MKKTDIAMIILVASASVMISYFVVNALPIFSSSTQEAKVDVAEKISSEVTPPDPTVFNSEAINPTVEVIIGGGSSQDEQATDGSQ